MNDLYVLRQVAKVYQDRRVVDVERLEVRRGEMLAVVGPSGAGKSTLLRLLGFLEPPDEGVIRFQGRDLGGGPVPLPLRRQVAMVFQRPALLSTTVLGNVAYGLRLRGLRDGHRRIRRMLGELGLGGMERVPVHRLSGGEMQRVALARALILQPTVLLLDEPTANLDPYNVRLIEETVLRMNREQGTTVVLVTHNIFQARRMAHRVALLLEGRVVEVAPTPRFFQTPQDPRTAAFVRGELVC